MAETVGNVLGKSMDDITGSTSTEEDITKIINEVKTHFRNESYSDEEISNTIDNAQKIALKNENSFKCKFDDEGLNKLSLDNCNFGDNFSLNETLNKSLSTLESCASDQTNLSDIINSLKTVADDSGKSTDTDDDKGKSSEDTDNTVKEEEKVNLFGFDFNLTQLLMIGGFIITLVIILVVVKMLGSKK